MIGTVFDTKYLTFGWWFDKGDGTKPYYFDAFFHAQGIEAPVIALDDNGLDELQGKATYEGAAAGKYAILGTTEDTAEGGHFTASAMLTADFDANAAADTTTAASDMLGANITGTIDGFRTGGTSRAAWKVTFETEDQQTGDAGMQYFNALNMCLPVLRRHGPWAARQPARVCGRLNSTAARALLPVVPPVANSPKP